MHELVKRLEQETGLFVKIEAGDTHTTVKTFDRHGVFVALRTFSNHNAADPLLVESALASFTDHLRIHRVSTAITGVAW